MFQQSIFPPVDSWVHLFFFNLNLFFIFIFLLLFFKFTYFNWRLITLQYCSGFCHTLTWISHRCTCVPHPDPPSHLPPHPISQGPPSAPALSTLSHASNLDGWSISHMIYVSMLFSQIIPPSPSPTESKSLFFTCVSCCLTYRVIVTIFLNSIYMC